MTPEADVIPIPGTSRIGHLEENAAATDVVLSDADLDAIERTSPKGIAAGERDDPLMLGLVNR